MKTTANKTMKTTKQTQIAIYDFQCVTKKKMKADKVMCAASSARARASQTIQPDA